MLQMPPKRPVRFFNTTGPCRPWEHYMLPTEERLVGAQLHRYIRDSMYWVLHAPRQTGKTTFLLDWMRQINSGDEAIACYVSVERCQGIYEAERSMPGICTAIQQHARWSDLPIPNWETTEESGMLTETLTNWAAIFAPKPLVVLFDEVDVLVGETIISFLRQLRNGFMKRGAGRFPVSIALVGMRDLKDYLTAAKDGIAPNPGSPFNVKSDSVMLSNFTQIDIEKLFAQRTEETGQKITKEAIDYIWDQSHGQPWIVNSLFSRATMRVLDETSTETVTITHIREAREQMVLARETHLDSLAVRLNEPGIRKMMETLFVGGFDLELANSDAFRVCMDLGLARLEKGIPSIANPIYRETLARQVTFGAQAMIPELEWQWQKSDGSLDMDTLLKEFQKFWRENSEAWEEQAQYTEAFPHLLLMAFLQRVLNGGGRIDREYAAGRGRMDLFVEYGTEEYIIEIKLVHEKQSPDAVKAKGLEQTAKYRDTKAPDAHTYLVVFDRRIKTKEQSWDERLTWETKDNITVVGC